MDKQQIKHIIASLHKKLEKDIGSIAAGFDMEAIHRFRVNYKKLRALLKLLSQQNASAKIKIPKKLKRTYTLLGRIRDIQLQQQKTAADPHAKKYATYLDTLQQQILQLKASLQALIAKYPAARSKRKIIPAVSHAIGPKDFKRFAKENYTAVTALLQAAQYSDTHIHRIRKHLKDVVYNLKSAHAFKQQLPAIAAWKGKDEKYLHQLLTGLGNFQDMCVSIALLSNRWLNKVTKREQAALIQLKQNWLAAKASLKKELLATLKKSFIPLQ